MNEVKRSIVQTMDFQSHSFQSVVVHGWRFSAQSMHFQCIVVESEVSFPPQRAGVVSISPALAFAMNHVKLARWVQLARSPRAHEGRKKRASNRFCGSLASCGIIKFS